MFLVIELYDRLKSPEDRHDLQGKNARRGSQAKGLSQVTGLTSQV
jgi:hypothetical protein